MTRQENLPPQSPLRWQLDAPHGITWPVACDPRLPHYDHLEMSGRSVSLIAHYRVDEARTLHLERQIIWPTLRRRRDDERGHAQTLAVPPFFSRRRFLPMCLPNLESLNRLQQPV